MKNYQEMKMIMLPSKKETDLFSKNGELEYNKARPLYGIRNLGWKYQNIYIVSNNRINTNDWFIREHDNAIIRANINSDHNHDLNCYKIEATTDYSLIGPERVNEDDDLAMGVPYLYGKVDYDTVYHKSLPQIPTSFIKKFTKANGNIANVNVSLVREVKEVRTGKFTTEINTPTIWETKNKVIYSKIKTKHNNEIVILEISDEYIICAANYYNDGEIHIHTPKNISIGYVICGRRHHNCIKTFSQIYGVPYSEETHKIKETEIQGFLTNTDRFVTREEAATIALDVGQIKEKTNKLFSEDLY